MPDNPAGYLASGKKKSGPTLHKSTECTPLITYGQTVLGGDVFGALPPLDVGHGAADRHAGDVEVGPLVDLVLGVRLDGKVGWHPAH